MDGWMECSNVAILLPQHYDCVTVIMSLLPHYEARNPCHHNPAPQHCHCHCDYVTTTPL